MEKAEFKQIDKYIKNVETNLGQLGTRSFTPERHLTKLHLVIERLVNISGKSKDQKLKSSLGTLEHRARQCMQCIELKYIGRN